MIVASSRSSINTRHLGKATMSTGKEGLVSEGNAAYSRSRCVDELESQLSKHGSLKNCTFITSMAASHNCLLKHNVGPEGRPQHCCAWLGAACSFPECASAIIPEEVIRAVHFQPAPFCTDLDVTHTHSDESKLLQLQFSLEQWMTLPAGSERLPVHTVAS